ncbi:hypothetical protein FOL47_004114 [Perkinsus chesapeaki]|uniref:GCVT N-terminal domain-containing protein n=1 Tax=Perkinsus chesapeaki TaxID=330153 RepID=A0A7J6M481_PERCH|nr:hypothetical protein FOL47_004114 [Perkinsus chesapeaki]
MSNNVRQVNQDYNPSRVIKEVFGIEISENKYARRLQVFLTFAFVPPLINVTFMIMVTILYLPISYQTCFVSLICPFVPLIAYYSFVYASPRLLLLYGLSAWIMIGLRAFALAQVFNHLSLVKALILSCTVNDDGTVIEAVEHSESGGHFADPSMDPLNLDGDDSVHDKYMKKRMEEIDGDFVDKIVKEGKTGGDMFETFEAHLSAIADFKATKVAAATQRESHINKITKVEYNPLHAGQGKAHLMEPSQAPSYALEGRKSLPPEQHVSLQPKGKAVDGRFITGKRSRDKKADPRFATPDARAVAGSNGGLDEKWMEEDDDDNSAKSDREEDEYITDDGDDEFIASREEEFSDEDDDDNEEEDRFERPYEEKGWVDQITSSIAMSRNFQALRANDGDAFPVNVDTESPYGDKMRASGMGEVWREMSPSVMYGEYLETAVPLAHTKTLEEYHAAKRDAVIADESYKQLYWITGEDRQIVADHFLTLGLRNLTTGDVQFSCIIDTRALVLDMCHVYTHPDAIAVLTEGHARPQLYDYLCQYILYSRQSGLDVRIQPITLQAVLSVHGPRASIALSEMFSGMSGDVRLETLNHVTDPESGKATRLPTTAVSAEACGVVVMVGHLLSKDVSSTYELGGAEFFLGLLEYDPGIF